MWNVCFQTCKNNDSRTIAPEENCSPTPKLTLTQLLALTRSQIFSGAIFWLPPNPKTNPNLDQNPNRKWGGGGGVQLSGYQK